MIIKLHQYISASSAALNEINTVAVPVSKIGVMTQFYITYAMMEGRTQLCLLRESDARESANQDGVSRGGISPYVTVIEIEGRSDPLRVYETVEAIADLMAEVKESRWNVAEDTRYPIPRPVPFRG